jgi:pyruvate formate lyase activating enzyme
MKEAMLYEKISEDYVRCNLCAHHCVIAEGSLGVCKVRRNMDGTLYTLVYGRTISEFVDPVEKKPLYHFYPGSLTYSIATPGCNLRCQWCQNWEISQMPCDRDLIAGYEASPKQIVAAAQQTGSRSISYTYTEPTIFFEYAYDTARLAHAADIANIYVTGGYMTAEMLETFQPYLDAANVDLKAFHDETYRRYVGARLQPVLDNMKTMKRLGIWLEVTTLVIPELNDDPAELRDVAQFVAQELGADTPWHISRFFPAYQMTDRPPTPIETLLQAEEIGLKEGLHHVYLGNVAGESNTTCPHCGRLLIQRQGYRIAAYHLQEGRCPACRMPIAGVWADGTE